jgi:CDP-6-deoxy-D-xylo-4-hexulose-3-dehydrase
MKKVRVGDFIIGEEERKAIMEVLENGKLSEGPKVNEFEKQWAEYVGTNYSVLTSSGTSAIMCGLAALKYKYAEKYEKSKKIITTPLTYIATSNALLVTGFEPVYSDVEKDFNISPEGIEEILEKDPQDYFGILPVHLMGYSCDMDKINEIAKKHGLIVFEDSAQAHGTIYKGKKTGSLSLLSDFSFYIAHNIQAGEMGAINTDDAELSILVKKIKANGRMCACNVCKRSEGNCINKNSDFDPRFTHELIGYNFKVMEFQAALGLVQLKKADEITRKRKQNVKYLCGELAEFTDRLILPDYSEDVSYLAYPITLREDAGIKRDKLTSALEEEGIETRPLFGCIPTQQKAYAYLKQKYAGQLKNAEYFGENSFYIGCHQYLDDKDLGRIVGSFKKILK